MLICILLILSLLNGNGVIYHQGWYMQVPWLHKIAIPFTLLITPVAWLYVRSVLGSELKARKTDWLILIPAILFAINLLPYYAMPLDEKRAYLEEYYQKSALRTSDSEGYLPAYVFAYFRGIWSITFVLLNYILIRKFGAGASEKTREDNKALIYWLQLLNSLLALLVAAAVFVAIIAPIKKTGFNLLDLSLGLIVFVICVQLFIRPKILYGVYLPLHATLNPDITISDEAALKDKVTFKDHSEEKAIINQAVTISSSDAIRCKKKLETFFMVNKPYLKTDYSLDQLAADVHIPRYILSTFINREYGMGFREYLNRQRVDHIIQHMHNPEWKNLTLEAISEESGFNSRITFIKNFKLITGHTPSDYFKLHGRTDKNAIK